MADQMKPAYLIHGTDVAKIDETRSRLRRRAEEEGGAASLEIFEPAENRGSPDADALVAAIEAMSLIPTRRYLLADRIEKWGKRQAERVTEAVLAAPPDTTIVLIARGKVPADMAKVVKKVGGDVLSFEAPAAQQLPPHLIKLAAARGYELTSDAARFLISHLGTNLTRLTNELDRLGLWAGPNGRVEIEDLQEMVADTSETSSFALGDALIAGDRTRALLIAESLIAQGSTAGSAVYPTSTGLRRANKALSRIEAGVPPNQIERELGLPPFLARKLINSLHGASVEDMRSATIAMADLEIWTRGGADYPDELALDLALMAATDEAG
ncbi:MAG TPA: DNA polymerase III subunit delta [Solirubrobacterales bacterium]|nr:DNA polymerase III subunit delta [Solirubrobacterales bacterium]